MKTHLTNHERVACGVRSKKTLLITAVAAHTNCKNCRRTKAYKKAATPVVEAPQLSLFHIPAVMRATSEAPSPIAVLPLGGVSERDLRLTEYSVTNVFGAKTERLPVAPLEEYYFARDRGQYDADRLLEVCFDRLPRQASRIIAVLDKDMYAAGRSFIFGYAHLRDGVSVYSLARLREEWYGRTPDPERLDARAYRCITHELGHTYGNPHCEHQGCVMRAVSQVESLDALSPSFCESCMRRMRRAVKIGATSAEGYFLRAGAALRRRQMADAIGFYRDAAARAPMEPRYHNDLGVALLAAADREEARRAFLRATELAADFPHPYYNLGIICREGGESIEVAERYFTAGLLRDPDPLSAHRYLGKLYDELFGDRERALRHFNAYMARGGTDSDVIYRAEMLGGTIPDSVYAARH